MFLRRSALAGRENARSSAQAIGSDFSHFLFIYFFFYVILFSALRTSRLLKSLSNWLVFLTSTCLKGRNEIFACSGDRQKKKMTVNKSKNVKL